MIITKYEDAFDFLLAQKFTIQSTHDDVMGEIATIYKPGYEDSTMHNMTESEVIEYANKLKGYEPPKDVIPNEQFPNGFDDWHETHFEMVKAIVEYLDKSTEGVIHKVAEEEGTGGLYGLAKEWTNEFETVYVGKEWGVDDDTQYTDAIDEFISNKLKQS